MKKFFTVCLLFLGTIGFAQTLSLTSPAGLTPPYEVLSGTVVSIQWDYFSSEPSNWFTYNQDPGSDLNLDWQFSTNPDWTSVTGWTDNGDGTYSLEFTITEDTWIFGVFNTFSGNSFSNVIQVNVASNVVLSFEDGLICESGDTETLSVAGSYTTYQWYQDMTLITGATSSTYDATSAGSYYVIADDEQSNVLTIETTSVDFSGSINVDGTVLTLSANAGMDSYQWYSGTDEANMTAISGATGQEYAADLATDLTYYHVVATLGTCEVTSQNRSANLAMFETPVISVNADTNEYNVVCEGTTISLSIDEGTENFTWYRNGYSSWQTTTTITISNNWSTGEYYVIASIIGWPEIEIQSNTVDVSYYELIAPALFGEVNFSLHCSGDDITIDLSDEGYNYTWYAHESFTYNDTDIVDGISTSYSFTFENSIRVTVVGEFQGCQTSSTIALNAYEDQTIYVGLTNYDQQYLCTDSVANIALDSFTAANYTDFQWFHKDGDIWNEIAGATSSSYAAADSGFYKLQATSINCASAIIESNEYQVRHYLERNLNLYVDQPEMCLGDTATLNIYSNSWSSIQWLEGNIQIGDGGYEMMYVPISGAGNENSQEVYDFNRYIIKAKHNSCPNGLKITSNIVQVKPSLNPEVLVNVENYTNQIALWDSAIFYLDCVGNTINVSVEDNYDSYQWYENSYTGLDDYELGDPIDAATSNSYNAVVNVQWLTAEVSLDGCIGYTDPILMDGWAFSAPVVASYNNDIICEDDSALIHLAFPGDWIEYFWLHDLDTVPNSNNDSIWVTEPGQYIIFAYPEQCPDAVYTSGQGPEMSFLEALILEDADTEGNELFYAFPFAGNFEFQWYIDGIPYENPSEFPWVLWKDGLPAGEITVEITSLPDVCVDLSEAVSWNPVGINEISSLQINVFPNPTNALLNISGIDPLITESAVFYNTQGQVMMNFNINSENQKIDISSFPKGMYVLRIIDREGNVYAKTVNKL